ncbi:MAG: recombinase family protein [Bacteroidota bacterium]
MISNEPKVALIYARVSTKKQDPKAQLIRCDEYCRQNGYTVEKIFEDKFTGGGNFMERPAMRALLKYAQNHSHQEYIVVFDDLKRFARDTKFHIELRTAFSKNGLIPECLNYNFDDTPEGRFMETMFAAQNELERHQNRRQVIQKQRARLIAGYNAFVPPKGYSKKKKDPIHGTIDVPNEQALAIKQALKMFAKGEFDSRTEVAQFLKNKGVLGKQASEKYSHKVKNILTNHFYAGYIEYLPWNVTRRKGHHEPLITLNEYNRIQARLMKTDHYKPIRKDVNPDFPLRGLINCYYCKMKLTACKSKGRWGGLYYKYYCRNKHCYLRTAKTIKSVSSNALHEEFKELIDSFKANEKHLSLAKVVLSSLAKTSYNERSTNLEESTKRKEVLESKIDHLISLVSNPTTSDILREQYEKKIESMSKEIEGINAFMSSTKNYADLLRTPINKMCEILKNPYKIWKSYDPSKKMTLFNLLFESNLEYKPNEGFRTPKKTILIRLFEQFSTLNMRDVNLPPKTSNPKDSKLLSKINTQLWNTYIEQMLHDQSQ